MVRKPSTTNFQTQKRFEKFHYKYIPLCNFVCLKLSFKASESVNLLIFTCRALFLAKISYIGTTLHVKIYS